MPLKTTIFQKLLFCVLRTYIKIYSSVKGTGDNLLFRKTESSNCQINVLNIKVATNFTWFQRFDQLLKVMLNYSWIVDSWCFSDIQIFWIFKSQSDHNTQPNTPSFKKLYKQGTSAPTRNFIVSSHSPTVCCSPTTSSISSDFHSK